MGKRGPKATPTAILKVRGSWRANERKDEPELVVEDFPPPGWLSDDALLHWPDLCDNLRGMGVLSKQFQQQMAQWCQLMAMLIRVNQECDESPMVDRGEKGASVSPELRAALDVYAKWQNATAQLGLTPSAITGVRSTKSEKSEKKGIGAFKIG